MSRRFNENTINGVLYRVEEDVMSGDFRVVGHFSVPGHDKQHVSCVIHRKDANNEVDASGLTRGEDTLLNAAMRLAVLQLDPYVKHRKAQLTIEESDEDDYLNERLFDPYDPDMDPDLAHSMLHGKPQWVRDEEKKAAEVAARRMAEIQEKARQQAEKERIERERQERDTMEMESSELWGAF